MSIRLATAMLAIGAGLNAAPPQSRDEVLNTLLTSDFAKREAAIQSVRMGPAGKAAAPALGRALKDTDSNVRFAAVAALGAIGPAAKDQVGDLAQMLPGADAFLSAEILQTLSKIGTPEAWRARDRYQRPVMGR